MRVVPLCRPGNVLHRKKQIQQLGVGVAVRVVFEIGLQRSRQGQQGLEQGRGQLGAEHGAVLSEQRLRQGKSGLTGRLQQAGLLRLGGRRFVGAAAPAGRFAGDGLPRFPESPVGLLQGGLEGAFARAEGALGIGEGGFGKGR